MRVVSSNEMREIEQHTINEIGFHEGLIIENIGSTGADFIETEFLQEAQYGEIVFLVGQGNNGSDALAVARHLKNRGHTVRAFMMFPKDDCNEELVRQAELARNFGVKFSEIRSTEQLLSYFTQTQDEYLVIDGIIGIGLRLPLSNYLFDITNIVNDHASILVSMDIPTGVCADSGAISGNAMDADFTMTVGLPKTGLYIGDGAKHAGEVVVLDGGFPNELLAGGDKALLTKDSVVSLYGPRNKFAHKNSFGHCLIVGGSPGLAGALIMASRAALKVGTGLVTASTWKESYPELCSRSIPEIMTGLIPTDRPGVDVIIKELSRWDSIVIGPGLGRGEQARNTLMEVLNHFAGPVVVDADALRVLDLKEDGQVIAQRNWPTILTPHMGEFADLVGVETTQVLENPLGYLKELIDQLNCCVVLKGSCTYVGFPSGEIYINYFPNDGMASGGSGDVLAGMLGGLLAQYPMEVKSSSIFADKSVVYNAVKLGVVAHTLAGKYAVGKLGARSMTAGSIIEHLSDAFFELEEGLS